jgi:predicted ester cyclase
VRYDPEAMSGPSDHRQLVERYLQAYASGDTTGLAEIIARDFVDHTFPHHGGGVEGVRHAIEMVQAGLSEITCVIELCVSQADWVAFRVQVSGTHVGEFLGKPATGNRVVWSAADFARVEGGKFRELWSVHDSAAMLLGVGARLL